MGSPKSSIISQDFPWNIHHPAMRIPYKNGTQEKILPMCRVLCRCFQAPVCWVGPAVASRELCRSGRGLSMMFFSAGCSFFFAERCLCSQILLENVQETPDLDRETKGSCRFGLPESRSSSLMAWWLGAWSWIINPKDQVRTDMLGRTALAGSWCWPIVGLKIWQKKTFRVSPGCPEIAEIVVAKWLFSQAFPMGDNPIRIMPSASLPMCKNGQQPGHWLRFSSQFTLLKPLSPALLKPRLRGHKVLGRQEFAACWQLRLKWLGNLKRFMATSRE